MTRLPPKSSTFALYCQAVISSVHCWSRAETPRLRYHRRHTAKLVTKARRGLRRLSPARTPWNFPYRFLLLLQQERCQTGRSRGTKRLKLRKTLHLADTIGGGKRIQENPTLSAMLKNSPCEQESIPWLVIRLPLLQTSWLYRLMPK